MWSSDTNPSNCLVRRYLREKTSFQRYNIGHQPEHVLDILGCFLRHPSGGKQRRVVRVAQKVKRDDRI